MHENDTGPRLGFLYPGHAAEDDYPRIAELLSIPVSVQVVHTSVGEDAHRVDALLDIGDRARLLAGAAELRDAGGVDAAVWACTSGSFVFEWEGAHRQARDIAEFLGVPASSSSLAFVEAVRALGVGRVAIAATYPEDVANAFSLFLRSADIEAVSVGAEDVITAAEVGTFGAERVLSFVTAGDHPDAEAVLVPDTALHTIAWIEELEARVGKPVLTANQVSVWEALRLVDRVPSQRGLGRLFALETTSATPAS